MNESGRVTNSCMVHTSVWLEQTYGKISATANGISYDV